MVYFSGFCFQNEQKFFKDFLIDNDFTVAGFSYGAIKAFEFAMKADSRIDTLQLFSPAFFQETDENFKKLQLRAFKKNKNKYLDAFYKNVLFPCELDISDFKKEGSLQELDKLLHYEWEKEKLDIITKRGIKLEIYLGEADKIIDAKKAKEFFIPYATVYWLNNCGHILYGG
jgi:pimeloyl-ACP methyl ester carboxylesterase